MLSSFLLLKFVYTYTKRIFTELWILKANLWSLKMYIQSTLCATFCYVLFLANGITFFKFFCLLLIQELCYSRKGLNHSPVCVWSSTRLKRIGANLSEGRTNQFRCVTCVHFVHFDWFPFWFFLLHYKHSHSFTISWYANWRMHLPPYYSRHLLMHQSG